MQPDSGSKGAFRIRDTRSDRSPMPAGDPPQTAGLPDPACTSGTMLTEPVVQDLFVPDESGEPGWVGRYNLTDTHLHALILQVLHSPYAECIEYRKQGFSVLGQRVLDAGRDLGEDHP